MAKTPLRGQHHRPNLKLVGKFAVNVFFIHVQTPLASVAMHVVQAPWVRLFLANFMRQLFSVTSKPRIISKLGRICSIAISTAGASPTGILPLRFGGQAIPAPSFPAQPPAILHRGVMGDANHRITLTAMPKGLVRIRRGWPGDSVALARFSFFGPGLRLPLDLPKLVEFIPGHFGFANVIRSQLHFMLRAFVFFPTRLRFRRSHFEFATRDGNHVKCNFAAFYLLVELACFRRILSPTRRDQGRHQTHGRQGHATRHAAPSHGAESCFGKTSHK